jgi:hypothetical protein
MKRFKSLIICVTCSLLALLIPAAHAAFVPFNATVDGTSSITGVVDPTGPVVQVQTAAQGLSSLGAINYFSGDLLNLGTGVGTGTNRFVMANGDELFGSFDVQMLPGLDPSLFSLSGLVTFAGGTGQFLHARGGASLLGNGQFFSASQARTHFTFAGRLDPQGGNIPEPATALLAAGALLLMAGLRRATRARQTRELWLHS